MNPRRFYYFFIPFDIICVIFQTIGAAVASDLN